VLYDLHSQVPCVHTITAPNVNDVEEGSRLDIEPHATYVFDKGYCDYNWWAAIAAQGAYFVTRFKRNAALRPVEARPIPAEAAGEVLEDHVVCFAHKHPRAGRRNRYERPLRRIVIARPDEDSPLVLATNDLDSPALSIGRRYKDRWQIELFQVDQATLEDQAISRSPRVGRKAADPDRAHRLSAGSAIPQS
jgi:IS4 transposase